MKSSPVVLLIAVATACGGAADPLQDVALEPIVTLSFDSLFAPTRSAVVGVSSNASKIAVTPARGSGEIYLFENGEIEAVYRGKGRGPAELGRVEDILFGAGDTLYVLDSENSKILLFTPNLQYARVVSLEPGTRRLVFREDGGMVTVREGLTSLDLQVVDSSGSSRPFATLAPDASGIGGSTILAGSRAGLWAATGGTYDVTQFSASGEVLNKVERQPEWWGYQPGNAERFAEGIGTESRLVGLSAEQEVLWVLAGTPPERYPDVDPSALDFGDPEVVNQLGDHVIEAVDMESGELLADLRIDHLGTHVLPNGFAWVLEYEASGESRISVVKLRLTNAASAGNTPHN